MGRILPLQRPTLHAARLNLMSKRHVLIRRGETGTGGKFRELPESFEALLELARRIHPGTTHLARAVDGAAPVPIDSSVDISGLHKATIYAYAHAPASIPVDGPSALAPVAIAPSALAVTQTSPSHPLRQKGAWWWELQQFNVERLLVERKNRSASNREKASLLLLSDASPRNSLLLLGNDLLASLDAKVSQEECISLLLLYGCDDAMLQDLQAHLAPGTVSATVVMTESSVVHDEAKKLELTSAGAHLLCVRHLRDTNVDRTDRPSRLLWDVNTWSIYQKEGKIPERMAQPPLCKGGPRRLLLCTTFDALRAGDKGAKGRQLNRELHSAFHPKDLSELHSPFEAAVFTHAEFEKQSSLEHIIGLPYVRCTIRHHKRTDHVLPPPAESSRKKRTRSQQHVLADDEAGFPPSRKLRALSNDEVQHHTAEVERARLHQLFVFDGRVGFATSRNSIAHQIRAAWQAHAGVRAIPTAERVSEWEAALNDSNRLTDKSLVTDVLREMREKQRMWLRVLFFEELVDQRRSGGKTVPDREEALEDAVRRWNERSGEMLYAILKAAPSGATWHFIDVDAADRSELRATVKCITECERKGLAGLFE